MPPKKKVVQKKLTRKQQEQLDAQQAFLNNAVVFHKCRSSNQQPISFSYDILTHIFGFLPVYPYLFYYTAIGKWCRSLIKELVMPSVERLYLVPFLSQVIEGDANAAEEALRNTKSTPLRFRSIFDEYFYKDSQMKPSIIAKFAKAPLYSLKHIYVANELKCFKTLLDELLFANENAGDGSVGRTYTYPTTWQSITIIGGTAQPMMVPNHVPLPPILQLVEEEAEPEAVKVTGQGKRKKKKTTPIPPKLSAPVARLQYSIVNCWLRNLATFNFYGYRSEEPILFHINYSHTIGIIDKSRFTRLSPSLLHQTGEDSQHHFDECTMLNRLMAISAPKSINITKELVEQFNPSQATSSLMRYMKFIASMCMIVLLSVAETNFARYR